MRTDRGGILRGFALAVAAVVVLGAVGLALWEGVGPLPGREQCTATVGDVEVELSPEQAENAALIAAIAVERGLPARAVSIALATAFQESKLRNLDYGDRDSLGLFQQRPSTGWGTEAQVQNPRYATNAFYDALVEVDGYTRMRITEAAQTVQRSGFPEAYEDHAEDARALASALTGYSRGAFTCTVRHDYDEDLPSRLNADGLTRQAGVVRRLVDRDFDNPPLGGFAPGGVSDGHMEGSAHYDGRAIDIFVRPVTAANRRLGWTIAHYLVAHAEQHQIETVIFDDRIWTAGSRSEAGWRDYDPPAGSGDPEVLEHRDHVHVDVRS